MKMLSQIRLIILFFCTLLSQCILTNSSSYVKTQDAWLYPGSIQRGIHLRYSDTADWSDLWTLMSEKGFFTAGKLCVRGVFVLYREPLYIVSKPNAVEVFSGNMRCTIISENTKSIQLTGSVGRSYGPSITFFQKPYFGSEAYPTAINVGSDFFKKMQYTRSAIIVGRTPWTLKMSTGESICVLPEFDPTESFPVCFIRDFVTLLDSEDNDENEDEDSHRNFDAEKSNNHSVILQASQGCKKGIEEDNILRIQDCQYYGKPKRGKAIPITFDDNDTLAGRSDDKLVNCGDNDEESKRLFKLYKAVVTKRFDTDLLVGLDMVGRHSWKLDLLDWMFTIVTDVIPDSVISHAFLNKARELFVHQLVTVWSSNEEIELDLSERNYKNLLLLTEQCEKEILFTDPNQEGASTASLYAQEFENMWNNIQTQDDFKDKIDPAFERIGTLNLVSEIAWIVGHMAGYVCHIQHMWTSHYWALYYNIFWDLYLKPVVPEWTKPAGGPLNLFFGGINYKVEHLKLGMFASVTRKKAHNLDALRRPSGVLKNDTNARSPKLAAGAPGQKGLADTVTVASAAKNPPALAPTF